MLDQVEAENADTRLGDELWLREAKSVGEFRQARGNWVERGIGTVNPWPALPEQKRLATFQELYQRSFDVVLALVPVFKSQTFQAPYRFLSRH